MGMARIDSVILWIPISTVCAGALDVYQQQQVMGSGGLPLAAEVPRVLGKALADEMCLRAVTLTGAWSSVYVQTTRKEVHSCNWRA